MTSKEKIQKTRENHLSLLSGMTVLSSTGKGERYYEFIEPTTKECIGSMFTYKKAKCFALGVDAGRKLFKQGL
jgi:hypothetical protein